MWPKKYSSLSAISGGCVVASGSLPPLTTWRYSTTIGLTYKLAPYGEAQLGKGAYVSSCLNVLVRLTLQIEQSIVYKASERSSDKRVAIKKSRVSNEVKRPIRGPSTATITRRNPRSHCVWIRSARSFRIHGYGASRTEHCRPTTEGRRWCDGGDCYSGRVSSGACDTPEFPDVLKLA